MEINQSNSTELVKRQVLGRNCAGFHGLLAWAAFLLAFSAFAEVPADGGEWNIGTGEVEELGATATISRLVVDGSLTLATGVELTATGAVLNTISTGDGMVADMTIASGASFISQGTLTGDAPGNGQGFSIGTFGGTGTVTVASGGLLKVTGGRLSLGRNKLTETEDRTKLSHGVLNISGTVDVLTVECGAWFPQPQAAEYGTYIVDELPVAAEINIEEGGVFEVGQLYMQDTSRTLINFRGGTIRTKRQNDNFAYNAVQIWNIETGKNLVFDTAGNHIRIQAPIVQPDFFQIRGEGGFVKKGAGYLQICGWASANTFSGPIVVEQGDLSIGRPLVAGQTVYVKKGARFFPAGPGDASKVTYEDPDEAPQQGGVFAVQTRLYDGLDMPGLAPEYLTDKLAGPIWGWNGELHGAVTLPDGISFEHPFGLVGQGYTLTFYDTGLENVPLTLSGTGTFQFSGDNVNSNDNAITFTSAATYEQVGKFSVQGENGDMPVVTISGGGTFKATDLRAGYDGRDGKIVISNGVNAIMTGNIKVGSSESTRYSEKGRLEIVDATVSGNLVQMGANALTDGSDRETLMNEIVLGSGATLSANQIKRNDDPRSRITFAGGTVAPRGNNADFFNNAQNGTYEIVAAAGNNISVSLGSYSAGCKNEHTHLFGDGGLEVHGSGGSSVFTLGVPGLSDFVLDYQGATIVRDSTLRIGVPLPAGSVVTGARGALDLNGVTITNTVGKGVVLKGTGTLVVGADDSDVTFATDTDGARVEKVGAGTLTVTSLLGGDLVVKEGTAVIAPAPVAFCSYRFKVEAVKGPDSANSMQFSELKLLDGATDVTRPYAGLVFDSSADSGNTYPANENPTNAVDGNVGTKWLDFRAQKDRLATDKERVWLRIDYDAPKKITGYAWYTANDEGSRDPAAWSLQGSNDGGVTWIDIDVQAGFSAPSDRKALAGEFAPRDDIGVNCNSHITVDSGATLRVSRSGLQIPEIRGEGTIELVDGVTLQSTGGYMRGAISGDGDFETTGGVMTFLGDQTYSGATHVSSGTLNVGSATDSPRVFDGKFFRLTIKRCNGGSHNDYDDGILQISEFQLCNTNGVVQSQGLTNVTVGTPAISLPAGSFSTPVAYPYASNGAQNYANLFDGDTGTKLCSPGNVNGQPANYQILTMRLRDDAEPIASYNFFTGNDEVRRSPSDWTLEGSHDGVAWEVLDERIWAPTTPYSSRNDYSAESVKYKPFNNGVNYRFETDVPPVFNGKFLRFTFKKTSGNIILQLSELNVFDIYGNNVALGLVKGTDGADAKDLAPGSFSKGANYDSGGGEDADKLFDGKVSTKLCAINNNMSGDAANYRVFTLRLPDGTLPLSGYLFTTANDQLGRSPCDWMVEGSSDGETWTTLDERSGVEQPYCLFTAMNEGRPFSFTSLPREGASLPSGSVVQVDAGATLNLNDANATIDSLLVDCTAGAGTIGTFRPAENGTLALVNFPVEASRKNYQVPITVLGVENAARLRSWTVTIDGVKYGSIVAYRNGNIMLVESGLMILIQ